MSIIRDGIFYGIDRAPKDWYRAAPRIKEIEGLCRSFEADKGQTFAKKVNQIIHY